MQIVIKNRESVSSVTTFFTPPINVSGMALLTAALIAHQATGTSPSIGATLQTSDNMEDWDDTGVSLTATTASYQRDKAVASTESYGQYVRFKMEVLGTAPYFNFSLFLNTFQSS